MTIRKFIKENSYFILATDTEMGKEVQRLAVEFAKYHVDKALNKASENIKMKIRENYLDLDMNDDWMEVDKESILNAYSLKNIK